MPRSKRLDQANQTLARAARRLLLGAAGSAAAAGLAFGVTRLLARAVGRAPRRADGRDRRPPPAALLPDKTPAGRPAMSLGGGAGVLLGSLTGLVVLLLLAGGAHALIRDERPASFGQPLPARRLVGAELLEGYQWLDEDAGVVRIPIERAMELLAERGLPSRSAAEGSQFRDAGLGGPSESSGGRWPQETPGSAGP